MAADAAGQKVDVSFVPAAKPQAAAEAPSKRKPDAESSGASKRHHSSNEHADRRGHRDHDDQAEQRRPGSGRHSRRDEHDGGRAGELPSRGHRHSHRADRHGSQPSQSTETSRSIDNRLHQPESKAAHSSPAAAAAQPPASIAAAPAVQRADGAETGVTFQVLFQLCAGLLCGPPWPWTRPGLQVVREGKDLGELHLAMSSGGQQATFGRAAGCEVVLEHASVSRRHATLALDHACTLTVTDLNSGETGSCC